MISQKRDDTHIRQDAITVTSYSSESNFSYVLPTNILNSEDAELEDEGLEYVSDMYNMPTSLLNSENAELEDEWFFRVQLV